MKKWAFECIFKSRAAFKFEHEEQNYNVCHFTLNLDKRYNAECLEWRKWLEDKANIEAIVWKVMVMKQGCAFIVADLRCYSDTPVLQESVARSRLLGRFYAKSRVKFESCILKMKFIHKIDIVNQLAMLFSW